MGKLPSSIVIMKNRKGQCSEHKSIDLAYFVGFDNTTNVDI